MTDQNRKTLRSFYCRDYLWELFEQMTHELGCSMDYLINESMRLYARSRDFPVEHSGGAGFPPGPGMGGMSNPGLGGMGGMGGMGDFGANQVPPPAPGPSLDPFTSAAPEKPMEHRTFERMPSVGGGPPPPPRPNSPTAPYRAVNSGPPPAPGPAAAPGPPAAPVAPVAPTGGLAGGPPPPPRPNTGGWQQPPRPPSPTGGFQATPAPQAGTGTLTLMFNNNRYPVTKDKFVIGRGTQHTDLTIRDGNISRKHCAVIFHNNNYYIKDLGSTNGIEFRGNRIESKKIDEGDVFYLCDYELRFTYQ